MNLGPESGREFRSKRIFMLSKKICGQVNSILKLEKDVDTRKELIGMLFISIFDNMIDSLEDTVQDAHNAVEIVLSAFITSFAANIVHISTDGRELEAFDVLIPGIKETMESMLPAKRLFEEKETD